MHYFLFGKGVISEFSYSLDNCEDTNLTLNYISPMSLLIHIEVHLLTLMWLLGSPYNRKRNYYEQTHGRTPLVWNMAKQGYADRNSV